MLAPNWRISIESSDSDDEALESPALLVFGMSPITRSAYERGLSAIKHYESSLWLCPSFFIFL
jgi:hypothetical protein